MRRARSSPAGALLLALAGCASGGPDAPAPGPGEQLASGVVFHDRDGDGRRDRWERGLGGVAVSNGRDVVRTNWRGRYRLPVSGDAILFVVKPRGWAPPQGEDRLPRFYYVHKPAGSPPGLAFEGVAPTGPLPPSVDFPLHPADESDAFRMILFGDTQTYDMEEIDFLSRDVIEELVGTEAAFGMTLGDLVGDDLALFEPLNRAIGRIGVPWYSVLGNHDLNFRAPGDAHSDETFERVYGPATYAFQVGRVHFIVLDDVIYAGARPDGAPGRYDGGLDRRQLDFVRNYLATVSARDRIVLAMHIPLVKPPQEVPQRRELFEILSSHPHTMSFSAHTHFQAHHFFGPEDGYDSPNPHHHVVHATTSGSWWQGELDEVGIPHATMRCGAPNGYSIVEFDGVDYAIHFRAARRPADHQMNVYAPDAAAAGGSSGEEVLVNLFSGSERSTVEVRLRESAPAAWTRLERVERPDPAYVAVRAREAARRPRRGRGLPPPHPSPHLWAGALPAAPSPGTYTLEVRARDGLGQTFTAQRLIRFE